MATEEELKTQQEKIQTINYINIKTLKGHEERVTALIKLNNDLIATGSYDKTVKIWELINNKYQLMTILDESAPVKSLL